MATRESTTTQTDIGSCFSKKTFFHEISDAIFDTQASSNLCLLFCHFLFPGSNTNIQSWRVRGWFKLRETMTVIVWLVSGRCLRMIPSFGWFGYYSLQLKKLCTKEDASQPKTRWWFVQRLLLISFWPQRPNFLCRWRKRGLKDNLFPTKTVFLFMTVILLDTARYSVPIVSHKFHVILSVSLEPLEYFSEFIEKEEDLMSVSSHSFTHRHTTLVI